MINKGTLREDEFVFQLNNIKCGDLSPNLHSMMVELFGIVDDTQMIYCEKTFDYIKPDILITHLGTTRAVSIKSGSSQTVHCEQIRPFIEALRKMGVSEETLKTIVLFLYGDGTYDGTGKKRYSYPEVCYWLKERIKAANEELNSNREIIKMFVDRVLFQGVNPDERNADAIYHGDVNFGTLITKEQVMKYIDSKGWHFREVLHVGPINLSACARYVDKPISNERRRNMIECHWPRMESDIKYIASRYNSYISPYRTKKKDSDYK